MSVSWAGISGLNGVVGQSYGKLLYVSGGTGPYTLTMQSGSLPPGLNIGALVPAQYVNGQFGLGGFPTTAGSYSSIWRAQDSLGAFTDATISIVIYALQDRSMLIPPLLLALPYSFALTADYAVSALHAAGFSSGLTPPYTYGVPVPVYGDALSTWGLSFSVDTFSASSVTLGAAHGGIGSAYEVSVTDSSGTPKVAGAFLSFLAFDLPYSSTGLSITCASPPYGAIGIAYSHAFPAAGFAGPFTFAIIAGGLPTGLTLNTATGVVSGTPTVANTFAFTIRVTDSTAATASVSCSITIGTAPSSLSGWLIINERVIGLTDRSNYLDENNPASYTLQQGSRSTASVGLVIHHGDTYAAELGTQMFLYEFVQGGDPLGYCVFAGTIDTIEITWDGDQGDRRALLTGVSFEQIFDVILIPTVTHLGQTTDFIVNWILENYCQGQPLIIGTIDAGPVIDFFTIDFESASDVFTRLAKIAGCIWGVDPTYGGVFYFKAPPTVASPFALASNDVLWETMDWQWNRQDFRDGQGIRIPFEAFLPTFVSFAGNGSTTIFLLPFRIEKLTHALLTAGTQATGTGTFTGNAVDGDTITIGDGVYVFNTVLDNTLILRVKIGLTPADTLSNFVDAINADPAPGKPGVTYSLPTWHHDAESATASGLTITVKSGYPGTVGNGNPLSDTCANFSWSAGATAGGTDADKTELSFVVISADAALSDVYYTVGVNTVNCRVAPPSGKNLIIGYYRQGADVITVEDSSLVTTRAAIEHSTGRYWQITEDSQQLDAQAALTAVRGTLAAYKELPKTFQLTTDRPGLSTGQTLSIALQENPAGTPALIDGDYLIQEVNGELVPGIQYIGLAKGHYRYTVHVVSATVGTYAEFWLGLTSGGGSSGGGSAGFANAATTGGTAGGAGSIGPNGTVQASNGAGALEAAFLDLSIIPATSVGSGNNALGSGALGANIGGGHNIALGAQSMATNTNGSDNQAIGYRALRYSVTGGGNVAIGNTALESSTQDNNVAVGQQAGQNLPTGLRNVIVGFNAMSGHGGGDENVALGKGAGRFNTGSGCVFLGRDSGDGNTVDDKLFIDTGSTSNPLIGGDFAARTIQFNGTVSVNGAPLAGTGGLGITIDGAGAVPATGSKGFIQSPWAGTITGWTIIADQSGSAQITVKKSTYSGFPTTSSIVASLPPVLTAAQKNTSTTLTSWTTAIALGDVLEFNLDSVTTCTRIFLKLQVTKT